MIDITTTRTMAARMHPPVIIHGLLFAVGLGSLLLAGYRMAESKYREYPQVGFIRLNVYGEVLVELRDGIK
jgi:hypothetical protein